MWKWRKERSDVEKKQKLSLEDKIIVIIKSLNDLTDAQKAVLQKEWLAACAGARSRAKVSLWQRLVQRLRGYTR